MNKKYPLSKLEGFCICILIILAALPLLPFTNSSLKESYDNIGLGNGLAAILSPFFSFIGSLLVYFAFKVQIKANKLTQEQFNHSQLGNLLDGLSNRIMSFKIKIDNNLYEGYHIFGKILSDIHNEQITRAFSTSNSIAILTTIPEKVTENDFKHFLVAFSSTSISNEELAEKAKNLKKELIEAEYPATYLYEHFDINKQYPSWDTPELVQRDDFLKSLTKRYFYLMDGEFRMNIYDLAFRPISKKYEIFLDSYFNGVYGILDLVYSKMDENESLLTYLKNAFTNQEKILLYHKLMTGTTTRELGIYLVELKVFSMELSKDYFIPIMNKQSYISDIEYIKPLMYAKGQ